MPSAISPYTAREKARAIERATATLRRDYERWIAAGRMKHDQADRHLSILDAIATDYRRLANSSHQNLFEDDHA